MDGAIWDGNGKQIGYVKDGFAYDANHRKRYSLDGVNLKDLSTGKIVGHLTDANLTNTPEARPSLDKLFA